MHGWNASHLKELARSTERNAISVLRGIFNHAIEDGLIEANPAVRLGRFTRTAKTTQVKGIALTISEVETFLRAALEIRPDHHALFLLAARAGLRRGELVALQWGDIEFGKSDADPNRYIVVQHNYVRRKHTTTKSRKTRRVDMSRDLPRDAARTPWPALAKRHSKRASRHLNRYGIRIARRTNPRS
jgi:integrase